MDIRYWESLRAMGWTRAESKTEPGTVVALDENKNECLSAPDTITLLKFLTNYFLGGVRILNLVQINIL